VFIVTGNFLKVKCEKCNNEQVIFSKPTTLVRCIVCEKILAKPTGGVAKVETKIISKLE